MSCPICGLCRHPSPNNGSDDVTKRITKTNELRNVQRKSTIQKFYDSRIQKTKECQEYLENLSSQELNETVK